MATAHGRESNNLSDRLFREPYGFDFFQAVRVLERLALERARADPRCPGFPVGEDHPPEQEAVRFRAQASLSFPASAVWQVRLLAQPEGAGAAARPLPLAEMVVSFMGATGPTGVLPYHYTALLLRRLRDKDFSLRDFLDMFHHRAIALFYRAWVKYRLPFSYERSKLDAEAKDDLITRGLYCLTGMGTGGLRGRLWNLSSSTPLPQEKQQGTRVDDEVFLYYSGHFAHFPRSALALECILVDYFDLPIRVLQLQGQWLQLASDEQAVMPGPSNPKGLYNQLGLNLVVGDRVWDIQSKFRLVIGPLTYTQFQRFLPNGDALRPLSQLTRTYVGPEFDVDVQLVLRAEEVPGTMVGKKKTHLGWNSWMRIKKFTCAVDDAVFSLE